MSTSIPALIVAALCLAVALAHGAFRRANRKAWQRIADSGEVIPSPYGDIEFTIRGCGPPVLVVHGSGGGYDQAELIAEAALGAGFRWIAPSRFGYLRSTFHDGATWDDQAHADSYLLDQLGLDRVSVVAMSHGGPSALLFAVLYPQRVASLTLISCGVVPLSASGQSAANRKGELLTAVYRSDLRYWLISGLLRKPFLRLIGATKESVAALSPRQRDLIDRLVDQMNPASPRSAGVAFDNRAILPGARIAAIRAPTLIFHALDDTLQLHENAAFAAATIPGARLISYERGGHVLLAVEQAAIMRETRNHILQHVGATASGPVL